MISTIIEWLRRPRNRPWVLLTAVATAVGSVIVLEWLSTLSMFFGFKQWLAARPFFGQLFFPSESPDWKDRLTALVPIVGLPVAFLLWHWRDRNVQDQIENSRKDTNLREFLEIQRNAAGLFDENVMPNAREQLQIAALHHLRGFITEDFGPGFQRAAIELIFAGHQSALEAAGTIDEWAVIWSYRDGKNSDSAILEQLRAKFNSNLGNADQARMNVISGTWDFIRESGVSLNNRRFDLLSLSEKNFRNLNCINSTFFGTDLRLADFTGASLRHSKMQAAYLWETEFVGADLSSTQLHGAILDGATFNNSTKLGFGWDGQNEARRQMERNKFKVRGARHINDPPLEGPNFVRGRGAEND